MPIKLITHNVNMLFQRKHRNGLSVMISWKFSLLRKDIFDFRKQKTFELWEKILLFREGKPQGVTISVIDLL